MEMSASSSGGHQALEFLQGYLSPRGQNHAGNCTDFHTVTSARTVRSPVGSLLRRRGLFNGHFFDVGVFVLPIGFIQESVDDVSAFLDPSCLLFRLFGEELVVDFPAH